MKKTTMKMAALMIMLFAALGSCQKGDKGDTGAAGTNGAPGANGAPGTNGTNGTNGQDGINGTNGTNGTNGLNGNANVHYAIGTTNSTSWAWNAANTENYATFNWNGATQSVVDSGGIYAYLSNGSGGWTEIPYTEFSSGIGYSFYLVYAINQVDIWVSNTSNTNLQSTLNANTYTFKFISITPAQRRSHPNTNWKNYEEVMNIANETSTNNTAQ